MNETFNEPYISNSNQLEKSLRRKERKDSALVHRRVCTRNNDVTSILKLHQDVAMATFQVPQFLLKDDESKAE